MNPIGITAGNQPPLAPASGGAVTVSLVDDDDLKDAVHDVEVHNRTRNAGFVQVSKAYIDEMNHLAMTDRSAYKLLWTIIKLMNKQNAVMISQDSLAAITKSSKITVKRAVSALRKQQWLEVLKMGTANVYRVNSEVVWQDRADGRWASFNARVILNYNEQDETTKSLPPVRTRHIPFVEADDLTGTSGHAAPDTDPHPAGRQ